jgi:hypothetical protein
VQKAFPAIPGVFGVYFINLKLLMYFLFSFLNIYNLLRANMDVRMENKKGGKYSESECVFVFFYECFFNDKLQRIKKNLTF